MKSLLIHVCCAPCLIAPYNRLKDIFDITTLWYNGNIHPFVEYGKRLDALREFVKTVGIIELDSTTPDPSNLDGNNCSQPLTPPQEKNRYRYIEVNEYGLVDFLRKSVFKEGERCYHCYYDRLEYTAKVACDGKFDCFTTSLLYSKFQKHDMINEIGMALADKYKVEFYYEDFRELWKEGIQLSKEKGMYRQQYCGCVYSEYERYYPPLHPSQEGNIRKKYE